MGIVSVPDIKTTYNIISVIGHGTYGTVYKVRRDEKTLILKMYENNNHIWLVQRAKKIMDSPAFKANECSAFFVKYGNIIFDEKTGTYGVEMEEGYINTLRSVMAAYSYDDPRQLELIRRILVKTLRAIAFLQSLGLCHFDISPLNITVSRIGNIKIIDMDYLQYHRRCSICLPTFPCPESEYFNMLREPELVCRADWSDRLNEKADRAIYNSDSIDMSGVDVFSLAWTIDNMHRGTLDLFGQMSSDDFYKYRHAFQVFEGKGKVARQVTKDPMLNDVFADMLRFEKRLSAIAIMRKHPKLHIRRCELHPGYPTCPIQFPDHRNPKSIVQDGMRYIPLKADVYLINEIEELIVASKAIDAPIEEVYEIANHFIIATKEITQYTSFTDTFIAVSTNEQEMVKIILKIIYRLKLLHNAGYYHCNIKASKILFKNGEPLIINPLTILKANTTFQIICTYPSPQVERHNKKVYARLYSLSHGCDLFSLAVQIGYLLDIYIYHDKDGQPIKGSISGLREDCELTKNIVFPVIQDMPILTSLLRDMLKEEMTADEIYETYKN
jgi:serine/threonine protein kinase